MNGPQRTLGLSAKRHVASGIEPKTWGNVIGHLSCGGAFNEVLEHEIWANLAPGFISALQKLEHL